MMNEAIYLESLQSAYEYIPKLNKGINRYITSYQSSETTTALKFLGLIVDGLDWVTNVAKNCKHLLNDDTIIYDEENTKMIMEDFLESIENNDENLTIEILEHEIVGLLDRWHNKIEKIVSQ